MSYHNTEIDTISGAWAKKVHESPARFSELAGIRAMIRDSGKTGTNVCYPPPPPPKKKKKKKKKQVPYTPMILIKYPPWLITPFPRPPPPVTKSPWGAYTRARNKWPGSRNKMIR